MYLYVVVLTHFVTIGRLFYRLYTLSKRKHFLTIGRLFYRLYTLSKRKHFLSIGRLFYRLYTLSKRCYHVGTDLSKAVLVVKPITYVMKRNAIKQNHQRCRNYQ